MNRQILFRGKRADNGEWVISKSIFQCINGLVQLTVGESQNLYVDIAPRTVGQFTGLTDKNGKGIFEGDILCVLEKITCVSPAVETKLNYEVIYNDGSFKTKGNEDADFTMDDMPLQYLQFVSEKHNNLVEVIGNVHDNKELLEVEK